MRFKKINPKETRFYVFEVTNTKFSIYDSIFDEPIYNGSWAMCEGVIRNIKKHLGNATIYFYKQEKDGLKLSPSWSHNI